MVEEILGFILEYSKAQSLKVTSVLGILYLIMRTDKTKALFIKLTNGILRVLFKRIIDVSLKLTKKGSLLNDILTTMNNAIATNDKDTIEDMKTEVNDIKKGKEVIDFTSKPSIFLSLRRPIDVMIVNKKYISRRNFFRNITRRRKLRRTQAR